ncbi:hypothetical protein EDD15DRAFT_2361851 [Pisolithus albus]|nr:hypothetical protein EDD15DRAFT_2361850 [Pisolithus albus]KAI6001445.1 hypothetical protein EDD15DRAFT_2361851 [Pisolithus albus]
MPEERQALEALREERDVDLDYEWEDAGNMTLEDVLDGTEQLEELLGDLFKDYSRKGARRKDYRTRRDRILRRNEAFDQQLPALTQAYLDWSYTWMKGKSKEYFPESADDGSSATSWTLHVIDVYRAEKVTLGLRASDLFITSALMRQGVVPCSPIHPTAAVTIGALELFRIARLRSPHFSVQAFVKTLCDLQGVIFQRYLSRQFSIAFDLYLQIRGRMDSIVSQVLQRDSEDWRLKHACAACTYKLTDEPELKFKLLYVMDGNDSLKRILRRLPDEITDNCPPLLRDLPTGQILTSSRYLTREYVNRFAMAGGKDPVSNEDSDPNPCAGCWKNMDDAKTKKTWGIYDETGIFMAVCRHGTCLLIADMVQSGERAKYPLAVVSKLMAALGDGLGGGYDIGCQFQTTLATSTLGPQVQDLNHTCLVGTFHGHAHRRLCQLSHLTLYVEGLGLEDLETCERTFSKSNALASTVRYATAFHRQQAINAYFEHNDIFEIYANLTNFLFDNYKQALTIIHDSKAILTNLKRDLSVDDDGIFHRWLEEEKKYLEGLSREPPEETLQMEYWQRLGKLEASSQRLREILNTWNVFELANVSTYGGDTRVTRQNETLRRHAQENYDKDLVVVQELERKLNVSRRWTPEDKEWQHAGRLVAHREYRRALDTLESLVVARLFELTKMNRAGTGYKLRKHIAKALQTRSAAIKVALDRYNKCALAMRPPRQMLHWEQVVEYAFLADFDLLRDTREDISQRPWANPTARFALDTYFKVCQAEEEIERLNIEIHRVITYMRDEECFLRTCEEKINNIHPALGHQVSQHRKLHSQFNGSHLKRLHDIAMLPGFSGTLIPGVSASKGPGESNSKPAIIILSCLLAPVQPAPSEVPHRNALDSIQDLEEEEEVECEAEEASHALQDVLEVSFDPV